MICWRVHPIFIGTGYLAIKKTKSKQVKKYLSEIKGIHPGLFIARELRRRKISKSDFARSIGEHPRLLIALTNTKRKMTEQLAEKIGKQLKINKNSLLWLQHQYELCRYNDKKETKIPDLSIIRPALFWDTRIETIKWEKQKKAIIKRVFERGSEAEKIEIKRFYGSAKIKRILHETAR